MKIAFLPQEAFFVKIVERPKGVPDKDLESYAQIQLEAFSPLPLDVLRWGFCCDSGSVMIFAASADRLARWKWTAPAMEDARFAFPFAALLWRCPLGDGWNVFRRRLSDGVSEYLAVKSAGGRWEAVHSCSQPSDLPESGALERLSLMASEKVEAGVCDFEASLSRFGRVVVRLSGQGGVREFKIGGRAFFDRADVRDSVSLRNARRRNFYARLASGLMAAAAFLFAVCLVWQISFLWQGARLKDLEGQLAEIEPRALSVMQMSSEAEFLDGINARKMYNMLMLAKINRFRPEGVTYTKTVATGARNIELRGKAQSVMILGKFESDLKASGFVGSVEKKISSSQADGSTWTMNIEFKD